ncbi:MAG: metalloregulator ArsR/SmtB family transcription factor [bacterium]
MAHVQIEKTIQIHQALSDATRVRIMRLLLERELCVCEIVDALEEPQYKISRHLAVLKNAGLVNDWREGQWMHYDIAPDLTESWRIALNAMRLVWDESVEVKTALARLQQRSTRPPGGAASCGG